MMCHLLGVVLLAVFLPAQPAGAQEKTSPPKPAAAPAEAFHRALLRPAGLKEQAPEVYEVKLTTSEGDVVIQVTRAWAPHGADRFYNLVKNGYYVGAAFFRVLPGFVVQFGLSAHPQVNAVWRAAPIPDDPVKGSNTRGMVTFATAGPNTRTTQVFINLVDNARLDAMGFSPFGEVTQGMDVVEKFYSGYGEGAPRGRGPRQDLITSQGAAYLEKEFPELDKILSATVISPAGAPPAPAKTPAKKGKAPAEKGP